MIAHKYFGDLASDKVFLETNWRPIRRYSGEGYVKLLQFKKEFSGVNEPAQEELGDFLIFHVNAHKYFGDLASIKICPETNWKPFVGTRGRST